MRSRSGLLSASFVVCILALIAGPGVRAAEGSVLGQVTVTKGGKAAPVDPTWKVQFVPASGGMPIEAGITGNVYEITELPEGLYTVQLVDGTGFAIGDPKANVLIGPGTNRVDLRAATQEPGSKPGHTKDQPTSPAAQGEKKERWKVWAIVGGAAAALALASGGGDDDPPASPAVP